MRNFRVMLGIENGVPCLRDYLKVPQAPGLWGKVRSYFEQFKAKYLFYFGRGVFGEAFQKIAESGLQDPAPPEFIRWWLFDHPPANERIIFYRTYDPWSPGREPRYVK